MPPAYIQFSKFLNLHKFILARGRLTYHLQDASDGEGHYNCGTMTRRTNNAKILKEDVLLINPADAAKHLINDGDMVCVESARGKVDVKAKISDEVKPGILSSTFHFPEIEMNNITSSIADSEALCPEYKVVACRIRKSKGIYKEKVGV